MKQASKRFWKTAKPIYGKQRYIEHFQLINLFNNPIEYNDKRILAEACFLYDLYKQVEEGMIAFYLASYDHHFSPYRKGGFESNQISIIY